MNKSQTKFIFDTVFESKDDQKFKTLPAYPFFKFVEENTQKPGQYISR